ncbi:MAG: DUF1232 domain-containing protein [Acidobacteriia bacterium]|nr:DUF1232 domain-containing protein [Terriglobia bacterium]
MKVAERWKDRAQRLKREVYALYFACRDPRVPWYAKALAAGVVGYALSPIDLIPDAIPVLGQLDDLVLVPLGVLAIRAMIAPEVLAECREKAATLDQAPRNWVAAAMVVAIWIAIVVAAVVWVIRRTAR